MFDEATFETSRPGVYLAGTVCGGYRTGRWFIENGRFHAQQIAKHIAARHARPSPVRADPLEDRGMSAGAGVPPPLRPEKRVPPERFQLPVERMRDGYYADKYFVRTRDVLERAGRDPRVTMQVFQKQAAWLGGVDEAIAVLKPA